MNFDPLRAFHIPHPSFIFLSSLINVCVCVSAIYSITLVHGLVYHLPV